MLYNLFAIDQQRVIASDLLLFSFPSKDDQRLAWIVWWWSFMFGKVTGHGRLTVEENLWSMAIRYFWVWLSARSCYALTVVVDSETVNVRRVTYILYYMLPRTTLRAFREFNTFQLWVISIQCSDILCSRAGCHVKSLWEVVSAQKLGQFWSWERLSASFLLHKLLFVLFANLAVSKYISLLTYQSISEFRNPPFSLSLSVCCRALNPHNNIPPPICLTIGLLLLPTKYPLVSGSVSYVPIKTLEWVVSRWHSIEIPSFANIIIITEPATKTGLANEFNIIKCIAE